VNVLEFHAKARVTDGGRVAHFDSFSAGLEGGVKLSER
jgi:hypothetical protein